jgi:hypothetical protein
MEVQSCSKKSRLGPRSKIVCRICSIKVRTSRRQLSLTVPRLRALCSSSQAVGAGNVVQLALYRRHLCRRLRRRSPSPSYGEAAMTGKHRALEAISASLRDVTSLRDFIAAVDVGTITASLLHCFTLLRTSAARSREA